MTKHPDVSVLDKRSFQTILTFPTGTINGCMLCESFFNTDKYNSRIVLIKLLLFPCPK